MKKKELWIIQDEGLMYFDIKEVSDILGNPKSDSAVIHELHGHDIKRYEKFREEYNYWQTRFCAVYGDNKNGSEEKSRD